MKSTVFKFGVAAMALSVAVNVSATVTMTLQNATTFAEAGFTTTYNGVAQLPSDGLIGIYSFNISPGGNPNISAPFYTTCLSPAGVLDWGTHTYDLESFATANPGLNPNSWANPTGAPLAGIQNANYLFNLLSGQITRGGVGGQYGSLADQGAAMALAMYTALYNSSGYGSLNNNGPFVITGGLAGNVATDYDIDISDLLIATTIPLPTGYVLRPDPVAYGSGQDMILLGSTPVPEPATMVAGALLLLPFAASTLRFVRRNRAA
jgi:hypothetical protein